jgi:hypothetical protein
MEQDLKAKEAEMARIRMEGEMEMKRAKEQMEL